MDENYRKTFSQLATVTIQGGGVFGLSLLGQLRAVEEKGFDVAAFSGSSAGALIACLAWAGYRADELLAEIQELLRDPGLDSTLRNLRTDPRQDQLLADIVKLYQAIGGPSRWGKLADARDAFRVLKLVSLVKRSNAFEHRGLYDGEGLEAWIDRLLRCKLDALRLERGFGPVEAPVTFAHFFETYEAIGKWRQPLLLMGVTNLSREDFLIIDSHSSAFQHLPVASVVRASISYPAVFRPKELVVVRDRLTGEIADSHSFEQGTIYESRELFVDGGVVSNFPAWTIFDLARETMWGGSSDTKQLRAPPVVTPLRASAYRPMVHIGLQVQRLAPVSNGHSGPGQGLGRRIAEEEFLVHSDKAMRLPAGYWRALFELATGGGRAHLESLLIGRGQSARGARTTFLQQNINTSGWEHHPMELNELTIAKAGEMFDNGRNYAAPRLSVLEFGFERQASRIRERFAAAASLLARQIGGPATEAPLPRGAIHFIKGALGLEELVPVFDFPARPGHDAAGPILPLAGGDPGAPQVQSLKSRSLVIVWEPDGDARERIVLCAPIPDSREIAGLDYSGLDLESPDDVAEEAACDDLFDDEDEADDELDLDFRSLVAEEKRAVSISPNRFYGVIFGTLTMEWTLDRGTAKGLLESVEDVDELLARADEIITGLVSPIGEALSSDFGRNSSAP